MRRRQRSFPFQSRVVQVPCADSRPDGPNPRVRLRKALTTIGAMLDSLTNGTRKALVLLVLLVATVAALIGATDHAPVVTTSAERALVDVSTVAAASTESPTERAYSSGAATIVSELSAGDAIVLACVLFVLYYAALLLRRPRVARGSASRVGGAGRRGPTFKGSSVTAPPLPPSLNLLSISRT